MRDESSLADVLRLHRHDRTYTVLYTGVTSDLECRIWEHKSGLFEGFTKRYAVNTLVYYETTEDARSAIGREKQIKGSTSMNPHWRDLSAGWYEPPHQTLRFAQGDKR